MFTFINTEGATLFIRDDAERAEWTQEEMTLNAEFPYLPDKHISIGQRVCFADPSTGAMQVYEVKQAKTLEPDGVQQVIAENICISELTDEHINNREITNETCSAALQGVLSGTLWAVGTLSVNPTSSANLSRGSVWQAILQIKDNWNVYIEPRVVLGSDGHIARYLDVKSTDGEWNGVRLSIDKNLLDPSVTYDDSEVYTALYGYGGSVGEGDTQHELTFSGVVWESTAAHPAKPYGQTYLEDPAATAAYGRNGRARFGYYQNSDITDADVLLQKTWETLQTVNKPAISIEGTVADLYRMGYADQPIKLHDIALVEVLPAGFVKQIQIIRLTTDLLNPASTTVTIGSYIPNIIYIDRKTNQSATGSRGGGGGNSNREENKWQEFRTTITKLANDTGLEIKAVQNDIRDQTQEIEKMSGRLTVAYNKISLVVTDNNDINTASIVAGINSQSGSYVRIQANKINLDGYVTVRELNATDAKIDNLTSGKTTAKQLNATKSNLGNCEAPVLRSYDFTYQGHKVSFKSVTIGGVSYHLLGY